MTLFDNQNENESITIGNPQAIKAELKETRTCGRCNGSGRASYDETRDCSYCHGKTQYESVDVKAILQAIKGRKGLRSKAPEYYGNKNTYQNIRAYYVWRMARFHGGVDVTMPVVAGLMIGGDPFQKELDYLAERVAKRVYGTDLAAAYRWAGALGHAVDVPSGMPASSYSGGPVLMDGNKPDDELAELY